MFSNYLNVTKVGATGIAYGCSGGRDGGRRRARGRGASTRDCARGKAGGRGKRGRRCSLPQRGAPAALARWREVAERRRVGRSRCGGRKLARVGFARQGRWLRVEGNEGAGRRLYRGDPCGRRRRRAAARLGLEPESSSSSGTDPTGGVRLVVRERGSDAARWAGRAGKRKAGWPGLAGGEGRKGEGEGVGQLGCVGKKKRRGGR
jgi:hypothetical protein